MAAFPSFILSLLATVGHLLFEAIRFFFQIPFSAVMSHNVTQFSVLQQAIGHRKSRIETNNKILPEILDIILKL